MRHLSPNIRLAAAVVVSCAAAAALAVSAASPAGAATKNKCPSAGTPAAGSTVSGGLEVDGTCILKNVTVNGGITVDSTGHLSQQGGTANGGINVNPSGELDVNATTNGAGAPTGTTSTINGGINFNGGTTGFSDADIWTAQINGGMSFAGLFPLVGGSFNQPTFCGSHYSGTVSFNNVVSFGAVIFGDAPGCPGNSVNGTLQLINTHSTATKDEFESNTINGSVLLNNSQIELNGNTIGGIVHCTNGSVILPGDAGDAASNACS